MRAFITAAGWKRRRPCAMCASTPGRAMPIEVAPEVAYRATPGQKITERRDCPVCGATRHMPPASAHVIRTVNGPFTRAAPFDAVAAEDYAVAGEMAARALDSAT